MERNTVIVHDIATKIIVGYGRGNTVGNKTA
jgi:hypothetical protein